MKSELSNLQLYIVSHLQLSMSMGALENIFRGRENKDKRLCRTVREIIK